MKQQQPQRLKQALENLRQALEEAESVLLELDETFFEEEEEKHVRRDSGAKRPRSLLRDGGLPGARDGKELGPPQDKEWRDTEYKARKQHQS
jgi:hypothetical protein